MKCRIIAVLVLMVALSPLAMAQDYKMEVTPFFGYTFSNGIDFNPAAIPGGAIVDKISPKSGFAWGIQADVLASETFALGFLYSDQSSKLELREVDRKRKSRT